MGIDLGVLELGEKITLIYQMGSQVSAIYRRSAALHGSVRLFYDLNPDVSGNNINI